MLVLGGEAALVVLTAELEDDFGPHFFDTKMRSTAFTDRFSVAQHHQGIR